MSLEELRSKLNRLAQEREFAGSKLRGSSESNERIKALKTTKDCLLGIYKNGILYDGLLYFDSTMGWEIYEALQLTGVPSADDLVLKTEVTEYALKLTKAAQEWAEGQEGGVLRVNRSPQYHGTPVVGSGGNNRLMKLVTKRARVCVRGAGKIT